MKRLLIGILALSGVLRADAIWSYTFNEQFQDSFVYGFSYLHDGPISGDFVVIGGNELSFCQVHESSFCEFVELGYPTRGPEFLVLVATSSHPIPSGGQPPPAIFMQVPSLQSIGTWSNEHAGIIDTFKISNDPRDLAPEPASWVTLPLGALIVALAYRRSNSASLVQNLYSD
jgi:hypothetical protein